jgi:folate-binding protein YgfZ
MIESKSTWLEFLEKQGAIFTAPEVTGINGFEGNPLGERPVDNFVAPLPDLGLISASGEDAATFLHSQLTNDIEHMGNAEARLAAYCSPKGRMLASLLIWKTSDGFMLQLPRQIQAAVQKRLQMYVLRSKVKLTDASSLFAPMGLAGETALQVLENRFDNIPVQAYAKVDGTHGTLIRLPDAGKLPRYQWIASNEIAQNVWAELAGSLKPVGTTFWRLGDIKAAIPVITQPTQDQFVPQMINFEAIGGINFKKGCYPGQEIVARTQYLGKLKRRMLPASVPSNQAKAGMEVFSSADPAQPCGMIVNAEPSGPDQADCLVEIKRAALEEGSVHLGAADGPVLSFHPLPYPLN